MAKKLYVYVAECKDPESAAFVRYLNGPSGVVPTCHPLRGRVKPPVAKIHESSMPDFQPPQHVMQLTEKHKVFPFNFTVNDVEMADQLLRIKTAETNSGAKNCISVLIYEYDQVPGTNEQMEHVKTYSLVGCKVDDVQKYNGLSVSASAQRYSIWIHPDVIAAAAKQKDPVVLENVSISANGDPDNCKWPVEVCDYQ